MKICLLLITAVFYIGQFKVNGRNPEKVNDGASTSRAELGSCLHCELQNLANRFVLLLTAHDDDDIDLTNAEIQKNMKQIEAFYAEVRETITRAGYGTTSGFHDVTEEERVQRTEYFNFLVEMRIAELVQQTSTGNYRTTLYYKYDEKSREIKVVQKMEEIENPCLCTQGRVCNRIQILETSPFTLPKFKIPETKLSKINTDLGEDEITIYPIISIELLEMFFKVWLLDHATIGPWSETLTNNFDVHVRELVSNLKRSYQKITIASTKRSRALSSWGQSRDHRQEVLTISAIQNSVSWLSGNFYIAPVDRETTNQSSTRSEDEKLTFLDHEARFIIGPERFDDVEYLHGELLAFVHTARQMLPYERLTRGFNLFSMISVTLSMHSAAPFNGQEWEKIGRFYTLKKKNNDNNNRHKRFIDTYFPREEIENSSSMGELIEFKRQWFFFVRDMIDVSMEARSLGKSLPWICNFTRLYNQYLFPNLSPPIDNCVDCLDFDEFLYKNVLLPNNWFNCNFTKNKVCSAWRNAVPFIDAERDTLHYKNFRFHRLNRDEWSWYLESIEIIVQWLSSPEKIKDDTSLQIFEDHDHLHQEYNETQQMTVLSARPHITDKTNSADIFLCILSTLITNILTWGKQCKELVKIH